MALNNFTEVYWTELLENTITGEIIDLLRSNNSLFSIVSHELMHKKSHRLFGLPLDDDKIYPYK